jgi:hypothetical protein
LLRAQGTFEVMEERGEAVMLPFLQDVLRVDGLIATIGGLTVSRPRVAAEIMLNIPPADILDWAFHFIAMMYASVLSTVGRPLVTAAAPMLSPSARFKAERFVDGLQFGSGFDYVMPEHIPPPDPAALQQAKRAAAAARVGPPSKQALSK